MKYLNEDCVDWIKSYGKTIGGPKQLYPETKKNSQNAHVQNVIFGKE